MTILKLKVAKSKRINPQTKQMGFAARVLTNGTADFDDIVKEAGHNTTMHKAELRMAFELCIDSVAEMLKQGYIIDLGPIGKLYPSCSSGWYEKAEDLKLESVKTGLYYHAGDEVDAVVRAAKLVWAKAEDEEEDEEENGGGTPSGGDDNGGGDSGNSGGDNNGGNNGGSGGFDTGD